MAVQSVPQSTPYARTFDATDHLREEIVALATDMIDTLGVSPGTAVRLARECVADAMAYIAEYDAHDWRVDRDAPAMWREKHLDAREVTR